MEDIDVLEHRPFLGKFEHSVKGDDFILGEIHALSCLP